MTGGHPGLLQGEGTAPRVIAWELTRRCALRCLHCRGTARDIQYEGELSTQECYRVIDGMARCTAGAGAPAVLILTGGEPMSRPDWFDIARYGTDAGLRVVMAPCGHLITPGSAARIRAAGIQAVSISLDGADAAQHDRFRGVPGAFEGAMTGLRHAREAGIPLQVNVTVTRLNVDALPALHALACRLGARTLDFFFLVPAGRGAALGDLELPAAECEKALEWIRDTAAVSPIRVKTTCAPHYARILKQAGQHKEAAAGGCMGGRGFVFISHLGVLQPCGFLDMPCGDLRQADYDIGTLYRESPVFNDLRRVDDYLGKCGVCEYRRLCGGCRARALARNGNYMDEEPSCVYEPARLTPRSGHGPGASGPAR